MISNLKHILKQNLPPFLHGDDSQMRFATTEMFAGVKERRFLFLTSSGPVEITLRPFRIFRAFSAFTVLAITASWMMLSYGGHIKMAMPSVNLASIITIPEFLSVPALFEKTHITEPAIIDIDTADNSMAARIQTPQKELLADQPEGSLPDIDEQIAPDAIMSASILSLPQSLQAMPVQNPLSSAPIPEPVRPATDQLAAKPEPEKLPAPAEPLDPEFVAFDGVNNPPLFTDEIRFHRDYHNILGEVRVIQEIFSRFNIRPEQAPPVFNGSLTPNKADLTELYLHRDRWRQLLAAVPLKSPLRYYYITSPYGWRKNKQSGQRRFHHGVDMAGTWRSELHPATDGIVSFAGTDGSFGKIVKVQHANNIETIHAHLSEISVRTGDYVTTDTILGKMGNTGRSDGMHLHYEVRIDGKSLDPSRLFNIGHQLDMLGHVPASLNF